MDQGAEACGGEMVTTAGKPLQRLLPASRRNGAASPRAPLTLAVRTRRIMRLTGGLPGSLIIVPETHPGLVSWRFRPSSGLPWSTPLSRSSPVRPTPPTPRIVSQETIVLTDQLKRSAPPIGEALLAMLSLLQRMAVGP